MRHFTKGQKQKRKDENVPCDHENNQSRDGISPKERLCKIINTCETKKSKSKKLNETVDSKIGFKTKKSKNWERKKKVNLKKERSPCHDLRGGEREGGGKRDCGCKI